ncbi:MAG: SHOCT domain-containing protein, partial [Clostridiales Family XIII bacterium]|nr:SHOCT domain-containing protein [Clostridiales Family XIII bacterium]
MSTLDEIAKLKDLLDGGAITQEEYDAHKARLFAAAENGAPQEAGADGAAQAGQTDRQAGQSWQQPPPFAQSQPGYTPHTPGTPYANREEDVRANKAFGILAYIFVLCFVSVFAAPKESHYARFHANQGLVLFLFEIGGIIVFNILAAVVAGVGGLAGAATLYALSGMGAALIVVGILAWIYGIAMFVLAII